MILQLLGKLLGNCLGTAWELLGNRSGPTFYARWNCLRSDWGLFGNCLGPQFDTPRAMLGHSGPATNTAGTLWN
eukprot:11178223-Lingulodinium_polyedra.AAC.1